MKKRRGEVRVDKMTTERNEETGDRGGKTKKGNNEGSKRKRKRGSRDKEKT